MMTSELAGMGFVLGILTLGTILVGLGLKTWRYRVSSQSEIARDEAYRKLAEEAVSAQKRIAEDLSDLRARVASMEKMLQDVE
ncbi:MAG: hypothetical protein IBX71_09795 [Candidatus Desulforudis sp.]|nr:hypothetical protein [Desulforudis sp.]